MRAGEIQLGHGRQRARAQLLHQPRHAVGAGCWLDEVQLLERRQHRAQRAQQRQLVGGEALLVPLDPLRLAQPLAAPLPCLAAQCCGRLVVCLQLLPWRLRQLQQLAVDAAEGHGDARVERVAQLDEDDELLVTAQPASAIDFARGTAGEGTSSGRREHLPHERPV